MDDNYRKKGTNYRTDSSEKDDAGVTDVLATS
jgi:hypothetical protein